MEGGAWCAAVNGVAKSWTRLSNFTFTFHFHALEKEMATHSSVLAWRIPGTGEPGGLPSMGSQRVGHDWSDLAAAAAQYFITFWWESRSSGSSPFYSGWKQKSRSVVLNSWVLFSCMDILQLNQLYFTNTLGYFLFFAITLLWWISWCVYLCILVHRNILDKFLELLDQVCIGNAFKCW